MSSKKSVAKAPKKAVEKLEAEAVEVEKEVVKVGREVKRAAMRKERGPRQKTGSKEAEKRPTGRAPAAMVVARHGEGAVTRPGRGYSLGELSNAVLAPRLASKWGVRVDIRRRSVLDGNVSLLRNWQSHPGAKSRVEGEVKKIEEELEKVGREVEKEAVKAGREVKKEAAEVKEEVAKVEEEVKKEGAKAEKAVKAKTKPKAKPKKKA